MPFPESDVAPVENQGCTVGNTNAREALVIRLNHLLENVEDSIKLPKTTPGRAASIIYLGLCRLKQASEAREHSVWLERCRQLILELQPGEGKKGVNSSYFNGGEVDGRRYRNHLRAIKSATGIYAPELKAVKKRCLLLLAVGSFHDATVTVPETDEWVEAYRFPLP